ncbi:transcriptional regulator [Frankia sp. EI5c]|uniref:TetR/AcrR family transcriptional regulator n=1 Tax=Frankia sp. EI5c TaxID=683316 RepID=UPI0007C315A2|nr:TetR/AcrR family transcriptional regulator [Frankia sp. EI5c]OAA29571.1 transcriptional regulator [Frankia sp. EI5c]
MRADARRNRDLIIEAALGVISERGSAASMEEIARAAGLGVGTLYRHFPDRQTLLDSVTADVVRELHATCQRRAAQAAQAVRPARTGSGWAALSALVEYCADRPLALIKALNGGASAEPEISRLLGEINELLVRIVEAAQAEGTLRADFPAAEVVGLISVTVCRPCARADDVLTTVVLDGLRTQPR